jgi:hypothetical protein
LHNRNSTPLATLGLSPAGAEGRRIKRSFLGRHQRLKKTASQGARLAHALPRRLEIGFAIFLIVVCVRFLWTLVGE